LICFLEKEISKIKENYQIYGLDYNCDGTSLALCGNNIFVPFLYYQRLYFNKIKIKVYDSETLKQMSNLSSPPIKEKNSHHIYGLKFDQSNPFLLFSGGWDEIIYLWDIRKSNGEANYLTGPLISTETLDVMEEKLLTGSWRNINQLEVWDLRKFRKIQDLAWNSYNDSMVQVSKFNKNDSKLILSSGTNQAGIQVFKDEGVWQKIDDFGGGDDLEYFSADFANLNENEIGIGNNKGEMSLMTLFR